MKKVKIKTVKPFNSLEEEATFWETHDLSPVFKNPKISLSKLEPLETEKEETITIRLQKSVKEKIEKIAQIKGINTGTLSRMWLIEKTRQFNLA